MATRCDRQWMKEKVMREIAAIAGLGAVLGVVAASSTASYAAAGTYLAANVEEAGPLWQAAQRRHHRPARPYTRHDGGAAYGCYRWGETGYHWYNFCLGPAWLYPHQRVCSRGYCWYQ
jgi:hypothetical protein